MLRKNFILFFLLIICVFISTSSMAQYQYDATYPHLKDSIYYPQIIKQLKSRNDDSLLIVSQNAFDEYYNKGETDRSMFLFQKGMRRLVNTNYLDTVMLLVKEKCNLINQKSDTNNIHYATMYEIYAYGLRMKRKMKAALIEYEKILDIYENQDAPEALLLELYQTMGSLESELGNWWEAYRYIKTALDGFKKQEAISQENLAFVYNEMGNICKQTGQLELQLMLYQKAFQLSISNPADFNAVVLANNLGSIYHTNGEYEQSEYYLNLAEDLIWSNNYEELLYYNLLSVLSSKIILYLGMDDKEKANETYLELEKRTREKLGTEDPVYAFVMEHKADLLQNENQLDSALYYYQRAIEIHPEIPKLESFMADVYLRKGDEEAAIKHFRKDAFLALENDSSYRDNLNVFQLSDFVFNKRFEYRDFYGLNQVTGIFEIPQVYLNKYVKNGHQKDLSMALSYSALGDSIIDLFQNSALNVSDESIYAEYYHDMSGTALECLRLAYENENSTEYLNKMMHYLSQSTSYRLNAEVSKMNVSKKNKNLKGKQVNILQDIRNLENKLAALDIKTDSITYIKWSDSLIDKRFEAFEIGYLLRNDSSFKYQEKQEAIDDYKEIQNKLEDKEALVAYHLGDDLLFAMLIMKDRVLIKNLDNNKEKIETFYRAIKTNRNNWQEKGQDLYEMLLGQWSKEIDQLDHLIIIPDGQLNQIPFEALYDSKTKNTLIEKLAISYHYSIWLWSQTQNTKKSFKNLNWSGFAPIFPEYNMEQTPLVYRSTEEDIYRDNGHLKELIYSKEEVEDIAMVLQDNKVSTSLFLYEQASEENFKSQAQNFDIIHLATHGYSSKKDPMLSGLYFLQKDSEEITNEGFLHLGEIFSLPLKANLVVLSACKSGSGKIKEGDAVQALPRAFIFNGVDNLVVSLWKIHDENTKDLMVDFYHNLNSELNYSQALRQAKIKQIQKGLKPKDWGAMILIGQ